LSPERELLQVGSHRHGAQITLTLGGEGVDDTGTLVEHGESFRDVGLLLKHGRVLSGDRSDGERATRDRVTSGQYGPGNRRGSGGPVGADPARARGAAEDGHRVGDEIEHRGTSFRARRVWSLT
jgi:hypothetical protein